MTYQDETEWPRNKLQNEAEWLAQGLAAGDSHEMAAERHKAIRAELDRRAAAAEKRIAELETEVTAQIVRANGHREKRIRCVELRKVEIASHHRKRGALVAELARLQRAYDERQDYRLDERRACGVRVIAQRDALRATAKALLDALPRCGLCDAPAAFAVRSATIPYTHIQRCEEHCESSDYYSELPWTALAEALRKLVSP